MSDKKTEDLCGEDLAWVAGLLEGEGCFAFKKDKRSSRLDCIVKCSMTDKDVLGRLKQKVGGRLTGPYKNGKPKHYKPIYQWSLYKQEEVNSLLLNLAPLMGSRRQEKIYILLSLLSAKGY